MTGVAGRATVLAIEDDPPIVQLIGLLLEEAGYDTVARLGRHALNYAAGIDSAEGYRPVAPPVAIVLDMILPGMPGSAVLQALHEDPDTSRIPVIVATAVPDRSRTNAYLGAYATLHKPFLQALPRLVDAAVHGKPPPEQEEQ